MSQKIPVATEPELHSRIDALEVLDALERAPGAKRAAVGPVHPLEQSAFLDALSVLLIPTLLLTLVDALGSARALPLDSPRRATLLLLAYVVPLFLSLSVMAASAWALLRRLRARARHYGLPAIDGSVRNAALAATLPVTAVACLLLFLLSHTAATRFNNHELAALLCAVVALIAVYPLSILWLSLFVGLQALQQRLEARHTLARVLIWLFGALPLVAVLAWLFSRTASGFLILGGWLWLGPFVGLAALVACALLWHRFQGLLRRPLRRTLSILVPLSIAGAWLAAIASRSVAEDAVRGGLWSARLVSAGRVATDVDGDGTSSLFGGGDCAPWDPKIHPFARDVPGDGVDSNCLGGDATMQRTRHAARWYDEAVAKDKNLNLIVVTIDAARADHFSAFGYQRPTTPHFDALARRSQLFKRAYSGANSTVMSILSLLSTRPPIQIKDGSPELSPVWVPELLQRQGFRTGARLTDWHHFLEFERGFEDFDASTHMENHAGFGGFQDGTLIDKTIAFIDKADKRRFMVWTHLLAPHEFYERPAGAPDFGDNDLDRYDSELWASDRELGRLIAHLEERDLLEHTVIIVSGDHAENFGDHGAVAHNETLFDSETHTAALMYLPDSEPRVIDQPVVHRDLLTTALNVLGAKRNFSTLAGRNLFPMLSGFNLDDDYFFVDMATSYTAVPLKAAVVRWPFKLIYEVESHERLLFNLAEDPDEQHDVSKASPTEFRELSELVTAHLEDVP
ncbi:MAG: sulfatase [Polyangiaceae bacterium]